MTNSPPYGVLLIAGGHTHQENYARAFASDERCHLIGLTDELDVPARRAELNRQLAEELEIPLFEDLDAALSRPDVDIVSVCAEPERRGRLTARAARAGKHVYIDKPIVTDLQAAHDVIDAVHSAGIKSQMFSLVRSPVGERSRDWLESRQLGELIGLHCELFFAKGPAGTADLSSPRVEKPTAERFTFVDSKRELFCVGLYPLVLFQWLIGRQVRRVTAATANYFFAEHQRNDVEDFACLLLEYEGGLQATITVGRTGWASHPDYGVHQVQLVGTERAVTVDAFRPRLEVYSDAPLWTPPRSPHPKDPMGFWSSTQEKGDVRPKSAWRAVHSAMASDATFFVDCIENDRDSDVPAEVGAHAVEVILAGYESAASGQPVALTNGPGDCGGA